MFQRECANDARWATGVERQNKHRKKRQEKRVLTVCCHPAWCSLLCVCMVLTSSVEKFCQVWSGLTFSLSRHVYSSPIPIKISTLSPPVSLPLAQTCITFFILPHLYFLPLLLTAFYYTDLHTLCSTSASLPPPFVSQFSFVCNLCLSLCSTIPLTMQVNVAGAVFAERATWDHRAVVANGVGVHLHKLTYIFI